MQMHLHDLSGAKDKITAVISVFWDQSMLTEKVTKSDFLDSLYPEQAFSKTADMSEKDQTTMLFDVNLKSVLGKFDFR